MGDKTKLRDFEVDDFKRFLDAAAGGALSDWENNFVEHLREWYDKWGEDMHLSSKQMRVLRRLAGEV